MSTYPKSVEAPVTRFFFTKARENKGKKNGGMAAVLKLPGTEWNDVQVYQPDIDGDKWWSYLGKGMIIRAAVREIAKNKEDLIAFALPLSNQPTATQEAIRARMTDEQKDLNLQTPDGDKLEEQLKEDIKRKQDHAVKAAQIKRLQRLVLMGEWLEKNESALKCIQSTICTSIFRWHDDSGAEADSEALHEMLDALHFQMDLIRDFRQSCWCPDTDCDGALYYKGHDGKPVKVIDMNELP